MYGQVDYWSLHSLRCGHVDYLIHTFSVRNQNVSLLEDALNQEGEEVGHSL